MTTEETRKIFEQLLKNPEKSKGKDTRGKNVTKRENEIVENLERSLTKDDPLLESNTYNGEAEKNLKNLRNSGAIKGKENKESELIEDIEKSGPKKPPRAKKKKVKKKEESVIENTEEDVYATVQKPVKKTKTPRKNLNEPPAYEDVEPRPVPTPRKAKESSEQLIDESIIPEGEETVPKIVVRKKKRTKKRGTQRALPSTEAPQTEENAPEALPTDEPANEVVVDPAVEEVVEDDGTILGVTIHHSDHIKVDPKYIAHPLVKVSIVDSFTGKFFNKSDSLRQVSSFYESESVNCIVPLMTQPYDFKANRSLLPRWEELLIFNEPFMRITKLNTEPGSAKPILFFVIRDFVTMATANNKRSGSDKGWHNVAWAFLKLVNANGQPNAGRKMRLQLFYPPRTRGVLQQDPNSEPAYDWWVNHPRQRYPATLYVTVKPIMSPSDVLSSSRSMFATQPEEGLHTFNELNRSLELAESESKLQSHEDDLAAMQLWSRLPGQTCKIPNAPLLRCWAGSEGSFTLQFSHRGTRLAAACRHETTYPILLYGIPNGEEVGVITGHQQLVYDLEWSKNDKYLLSASADGTAQVWDMDRREKPVHTLPHPCYVYTASFHPVAQYLISTGGYDSIVRIWNIASVTSQLTQELDGHKAIINSIIFDKTGLNMYSADGSGVIICWSCPAQEKAKKNYKTNWSIKTKIEDRDLVGVCINSLKLHPHNNKILIHCRDSTVRILDARIHSMKKFIGLLNHRQLLRSSVTPCGNFVFSGSEDGCVYVWNAETGDQVAIYNELGYTNAVHTVVYHPHDHMVAFCSFAPNQSILLYKFNGTVATMEAGFRPDIPESSVIRKDEAEPSINAQIEASKSAVKLERIKNQLDSVLSIVEEDPGFIRNNFFESSVESGPANVASSLPPVPRGREAQLIAPRRSPRGTSPYSKVDGSFDPMSTWGSTFNSTQMGTLLGLAPSYLSPHASPDARAMAQQYVRTGRPDQSGTWKPGVSPVGGSPYRNQGAGIPPDLSLIMDKDGKHKLNITSTQGAQSQSVVVVLFDYQANRSDELTVVRGDVIKVLYKDSANWWFGEKTSDAVQGYFPSSYVEEQVSTAQIKQSDAPTPVFGVPETPKDKKVYALKMPSGRLNFYSQSESEGDDERLSNASINSRQRRREAKLRDTIERRNTPSPMTVLDKSLQPSASAGHPKSILHSTRSKPTAASSSTENIKEVSFADEENEKNPEAKQKLIDSIQAAIAKSESQLPTESTKLTPPSASPRQPRKPKSRPEPTTRKKTPQKPCATREETSFSAEATPISKQAPSTSFGILSTVQALMSKNDNDSAFSQSVLGGHDLGTPKPEKKTSSAFRPNVHSTAVKKPRNPVENDEDPLSLPLAAGSVIRKARPLPKIGKSHDEESIPMIRLDDSKNGRSSSPIGLVNPAFDASP